MNREKALAELQWAQTTIEFEHGPVVAEKFAEALAVLSSPCETCGDGKPIAQFDDEMIWDVGAQCYVAEICLFMHHQGDHLPVRAVLLRGEGKVD